MSRRSTVKCTHCSASMPIGHFVCAECGAVLPQTTYQSQSGCLEITQEGKSMLTPVNLRVVDDALWLDNLPIGKRIYLNRVTYLHQHRVISLILEDDPPISIAGLKNEDASRLTAFINGCAVFQPDFAECILTPVGQAALNVTSLNICEGWISLCIGARFVRYMKHQVRNIRYTTVKQGWVFHTYSARIDFNDGAYCEITVRGFGASCKDTLMSNLNLLT